MKRIGVCALALTGMCLVALAKDAGSGSSMRVPPLMNGGIAGLWFREHAYIQQQYGDFELLNLSNVGRQVKTEAGIDSSWKLVAIGNFLDSGIQYATLAKVKDTPGGTLLIMFEWTDPGDTTRAHGVFYDAFLSKDQLLIRTKQAIEGEIDTLEFSCADMERVCGRCYYHAASGAMKLRMVGKD